MGGRQSVGEFIQLASGGVVGGWGWNVHLGHAKVSMTQDRYMSRGRVHNQVAELLDRAVNGDSGPTYDE